LEQHAASLAAAQPVDESGRVVGGRSISRRLTENARILHDAYSTLTRASASGAHLTPAAEWLVDNYHVIRAQTQEIAEDLPPGYYRQLPKLIDGPFVGYPRVLGIAWAFAAHTDSRFDPHLLYRFVQSYQAVHALTIGELWAIAITLRVVLVENLRRAATRLIDDRIARERADAISDEILGSDEPATATIPPVLSALPSSPLNAAFAVQLVQRLRGQDPSTTPALLWLDFRLADQGTTVDEIVAMQHQEHAALTVTIRNVITSMRMVSAVDWPEFVESVGVVDQLLRDNSDFGSMDFATRNLYRTAIEQLARGSKTPELYVTRALLEKYNELVTQDRFADPGHFLLGARRVEFEALLGYRVPLPERLRRAGIGLGTRGYVGAAVVLALAVAALPLLFLADAGIGRWGLVLASIFVILPSVDCAFSLLNRIVAACVPPRALPSLSLRDGIPESLRTIVVVPTLLTTAAAIGEQIDQLEIHQLASPDGDVFFALLTDWTDSATETAPDDASLLNTAVEGIARLNEAYPRDGDCPRFLLLHRRRVWNDVQGQWMGWERKRGKLHELNRLLRGATDTSFLPLGGGARAAPDGVRYVITLDSDTRLPREAVRRLVGKMAHRLNRPVVDPDLRRVVAGHGLLQPRVTPSLPVGMEASVFQYAFSTAGGIDPYAAAVSDVYQDLFDQGSYAGKGIYDLDVFETVLAGRVPDNALLSHDLFEGIFVRAGLASDIEFIDEFPARYDVAASREHRWTRGDWQLLPWIFGRAGIDVPRLGSWKMVDNLRRSLTPAAMILALFAGWQLTAAPALIFTSFVLFATALPSLLPVLDAIVPKGRQTSPSGHLRQIGTDMRLAGTQILLRVALLAEQAWSMTDAIVRTLIRLFVTHRNLLQWTTAEQAKRQGADDIAGHYRRMVGTQVVAAVALAVTAVSRGGTWIVILPFAVLWFSAPAIAWRISRSDTIGDSAPVSLADALTLRGIALRTWRFFEMAVTHDNNMLPPDNFQEDPRPILARRTSPTNIGLYLLSTVAAREFGWIGVVDAVARLEATLDSMDRLERVHGHFLNWYGTGDLHPLEPRYISSVDSGNFAGHLIALANSCEAWIAGPRLGPWRDGMGDMVAVCRATVGLLRGSERAGARHLDELDAALEAFLQRLTGPPTPELSDIRREVCRLLDLARPLNAGTAAIEPLADDIVYWVEAIGRAASSHLREEELGGGGGTAPEPEQRGLEQRLRAMAARARGVAGEMRFDFLLDQDRKLLSIGFLIGDGSLDRSCYDLLASEARLASFLAVANGDAPVSHWFRLGRAVTAVGHGAALVSWSGSMFEYLMPSLVMRAPTGSLLATTNQLIVRRQMTYAASLGLPWGMSESAYNVRDLELTYQYSNFGVPDLALKRGLAENAVLAPYATALAAMVNPRAATENFAALDAAGGLGRYGFYDALDYTPSRVQSGKTVAVVRTYMAHHQGMTIVAILNAVQDGLMRTRFHTEPRIKATELLLQERAPRDARAPPDRTEEDARSTAATGPNDFPVSRRIVSPHGASPVTQILSNGRYSVMITAAGSGYSHWQDRAVTRWREDATLDDFGSYIFLRDVVNETVWSAGYQPTGVEPDAYDVTFTEEHAEFTRRDGTMLTRMESVVSAEDDAEVRRITLGNVGSEAREIELTSFMEIVLAGAGDDAAHPAFSKMFVQTEFIAELGAVLATRRRRSASEAEIWAAHLVVVEGEVIGDLHVETDRAAFLGRGREVRAPAAMAGSRPLTGSTGTVLDPIFSLRRRVRIAAGGNARLAFWTLVGNSRQSVLDLVDRHREIAAYDRAVTLAWTQAQVQLSHLGITRGDASHYQRLAGHLIYVDATLRPSPDTLLRGGAGPALLWAHGISGDLPILLLRIDDAEDIAIVRQLLQAHEYWRMKRLAVDLVILNEKPPSYEQDLQSALDAAVRMGQTRAAPASGGPQGRVYVLRSDLVPEASQALLLSVARAVMVGRRGTLAQQLDRLEDRRAVQPPLPPQAPTAQPSTAGVPEPHLEFFNGLGGFDDDGREYVTILRRGERTPAPWTNIVANPAFGFQVTADGGGYSWWFNSRENQLTPWSNDPVSDRPGDVLYLRDEDSGELWTPTAQPVRHDEARYEARHGHGYSRFRCDLHGVDADLLQFVPLDETVKISRLRLHNTTDRAMRLSLTAYVEWVLGPSRAAGLTTIVTERDPASGAVLARNPWNTAYGPYVAFVAMPGRATRVTGDRREFLGRNGSHAAPAALLRGLPLSDRMGAGLDPCAAIQTIFELAPNGSTEIVCLLGVGTDTESARGLIARIAAADLDAVLASVRQHWQTVTCGVQVKTPDRAMDIMLNRWLLYQTLVCRIWARCGFYQASGAYGFRDQLQDGMAIVGSRPDLTRAHLLRAAGRQFVQGDVQHWWLPPTGQGVRTRISDDRVWLAYAGAHYVAATGDGGVLDEAVPFLEGAELTSDQHESYFTPATSGQTASVYEHCALGLDHALATGQHGLPLIGTGDWNDGMSRVGEGGKGESVWLAWFLYTTLLQFAPIAEARGEIERGQKWRAHAAALQSSIDGESWDGGWYRRGYFDDGTPLGSVASSECRIDSIAQSWGVISGAADPARATRAMGAVDDQLIRRHDSLALLFTPPFDRTPMDVGYIKGYPPGIRENGGQYTHAATWSVIAFAMQGDGNRAAELFDMLNPINHALSAADAFRYKVEPYVVAADVYAAAGHIGRGGWTWYTGSAGWMYRAGLEWILGLRRNGDTLLLDPCLPTGWPQIEMRVRHGASHYLVTVDNPHGVNRGVVGAELDGMALAERPVRVNLVDDGADHLVHVTLG
jgi:cyclic beta-1,2-glucan synthetase